MATVKLPTATKNIFKTLWAGGGRITFTAILALVSTSIAAEDIGYLIFNKGSSSADESPTFLALDTPKLDRKSKDNFARLIEHYPIPETVNQIDLPPGNYALNHFDFGDDVSEENRTTYKDGKLERDPRNQSAYLRNKVDFEVHPGDVHYIGPTSLTDEPIVTRDLQLAVQVFCQKFGETLREWERFRYIRYKQDTKVFRARCVAEAPEE